MFARMCLLITNTYKIIYKHRTAYSIIHFFKVKTISVDFCQTDIYDKIAEELNDLEEIFVLVNNVGTLYHIPEYFLKISKEFTEKILTLNMVSVTKMNQLVLPKMVEKGNGVIINISSQVSEHPTPLFAIYGASESLDH